MNKKIIWIIVIVIALIVAASFYVVLNPRYTKLETLSEKEKSVGDDSSSLAVKAELGSYPGSPFAENKLRMFTGPANQPLNILVLDINKQSGDSVDKNKNIYIFTQGKGDASMKVRINGSETSAYPPKYGEKINISWISQGADRCTLGGMTGIESVGSNLPSSGTIGIYAKNFENYVSPLQFDITCGGMDKFASSEILIPVVVPSPEPIAFIFPKKDSVLYSGCKQSIAWKYPSKVTAIDFQLYDAKNRQPIAPDDSSLWGQIGPAIINYDWTVARVPEGKYFFAANVNKIPVDFISEIFTIKPIPRTITTAEGRSKFCESLSVNP